MEPVQMPIGSKEKISPYINKSHWVVQSFASLLMLDAIKCRMSSVIGGYSDYEMVVTTGVGFRVNIRVLSVRVFL
jgi:hypothetical protein